MKVLLANYRYFVSGGPERYMFNITNEMEKRGHKVLPFSIRYKQNRPTPYTKYFVPPLGEEDAVYFKDQTWTIKTLQKNLSRLFYARDVESAVTRLIDDTQPDIAYVLHYLRKLSPALLVGLKKREVPIIVRLSDFAMLCPEAHFFREGQPCTLCHKGNLFESVTHRCVKGSFSASTLNWCATLYHHQKKYFDLIDAFVTTNTFMYEIMLAAGYPKEKLKVIPTFVNTKFFYPSNQSKQPYIVFVGRLENIKGIHILLDAWAKLKHQKNYRLKIAGSGDKKYQIQLERFCKSRNLENVDFLNKLDENGIATLLRQALVTVVPSLWFENLPNVILESLASGTPVLASDIGSLKTTVQNGENGYLFEPSNSLDLAEKLNFIIGSSPNEIVGLSNRCRQIALEKYSPPEHLDLLESLFTNYLDE